MSFIDLGCHAESLFCFRAIEKGLRVSIPWGSLPYDLIVDNGKSLFKVQVKRAKLVKPDNRYRVCLLRNKNKPGTAYKYKLEDFDYIACYLHVEDIFYIIPHEEILDQNTLSIYIGEFNKYSRYNEAWNLLQ